MPRKFHALQYINWRHVYNMWLILCMHDHVVQLHLELLMNIRYRIYML